MSTQQNLEQLKAAQKVNAEVLLELTRSTFDSIERLSALNIETARELLNASVAQSSTLLAAKDVQEAARLQTTLAQPNLELLTNYYRKLYELVTELQKDATHVVESHYNHLSKNASAAIEKSTASAPGGDVVEAALKSILSASTQVFDNMTKAAKQFADIADANVKAASTATSKAVSSATKASAAKK
ncbi:hypothetical protein OTERR_24940 [Oryzomicrobium terrae]|uniref:Phasin domain-containing protein n=1 Tax=Oryzomicrobium terrae TaxID=1735038 RepID=A0A5C1EAN7_9RHOO|nr:phasin family protein [Oryzomicrobium terrae]QEL65970.1 hypothetical protein OTERR_24940 [Oryzomicrobium terrae]